MKQASLIVLALGAVACGRPALPAETQNVILVTLDGLRWQEVFSGADLRLIDEENGGVKQPEAVKQRFWRETEEARRKALMPFFWEVIAKEGQIVGDPSAKSDAMATNRQLFSYPGYNELLCGFPDEQIISNDKLPNQNVSVLEWLNRKPEFRGRVGAFASWDVFPFIINQKRSGVYVNAGWQALDAFGNEPGVREANRIADQLPRYWHNVRYDVFTIRGALHYLKQQRPRVLYVALGETDDWAHAGRYDLYLDAAYRNDAYLKQLWQTAQALPEYRGKTAMIVSTDHGRGNGRQSWKSHGSEIPESDRIWIAGLGNGIPDRQIAENVQATQSQIAATVAALLGFDFAESDGRIAKPISSLVGSPVSAAEAGQE